MLPLFLSGQGARNGMATYIDIISNTAIYSILYYIIGQVLRFSVGANSFQP